MAKGGFDKIDASDTRLYGPRKMVLCGFDEVAQPKLKSLLRVHGIKDLPLVWVASPLVLRPLSEILDQKDGHGEGQSSDLPRAIIVSGITQNELHKIMNGCREAGMKPPLWAVLTPTSEKWPMIQLLAELEAERMAMEQRKQTQK